MQTITTDEESRKSSWPNWGQNLALGENDQSTQDHVYACCEEGRSEEEEEVLHNKGPEFPLVKVAYGAAYITDPFDCHDKYQYGEEEYR
jgi:hypothetical protein